MISLYIIAGFLLTISARLLTKDYAGGGVAGLYTAFLAALILAFTEWARATGVF